VERGVTAEDLRAVGELHRRATDLADRDHEFDEPRVLVRGSVDIAGVREHRREATMCAEIGRRDRDGRPHHSECGDAIAGLCEHRRAVLERVEIRPMHLMHLGLGGFDRRNWFGVTGDADRAQANVVAHC